MKKYLIIFITVFLLAFTITFIDAKAEDNITWIPHMTNGNYILYRIDTYTGTQDYYLREIVDNGGYFYTKNSDSFPGAGWTEIWYHPVSMVEGNNWIDAMTGNNNLWNTITPVHQNYTTDQKIGWFRTTTGKILNSTKKVTGTIPFTPEPTTINVNEYVYVSRPIQYASGKTSGKSVEFLVNYRIKGPTLQIKHYLNGVLLNGVVDNWINNTVKVKTLDFPLNTVCDDNGYQLGTIDIQLTMQNNFIGPVTYAVEILDVEQNTRFGNDNTITCVTFTDGNGDGIDDTTGQSNKIDDTIPSINDGAPQRENYSDDILGNIKYGFDSLMYYIKYPFQKIGESLVELTNIFSSSFQWVNSFNSFFKTIFGFLPDEVIGLIVVSFICATIALIYRVFRGA